MKNIDSMKAIFGILVVTLLVSCGGKKINGQKNVREIIVERELPFPVETVWNTIFMDFGDAHKFSPNTVSSGYLGDVNSAVVGAERFMKDVDGGIIHERIVEMDIAQKKMRFKIFETEGVPIDTSATFGTSSLTPLGPNKTLFKIKFQYRTSPKILAVFANGGIKKNLENMTIGIEHYLTTNQAVTEENFDEIAKLYD
ncbi:MAG: SRPBCC family protein [Bacteroidota bacterium]